MSATASVRVRPEAAERRVPRSFFARPVLRVARALLGRALVHDTPQGRLSGLIVEVEAYRAADDPASHAFRGRTPRSAVMFGPPGHAYVYFTYGMHHCLNLVTGPAGVASAVLIRALEPLEGVERMKRNRGVDDWARVARGPGCVAQALGITREQDGADLIRGPLWISQAPPRRRGCHVISGTRIGIRVGKELPWRFFLAGHPCVSGPARAGGRASS